MHRILPLCIIALVMTACSPVNADNYAKLHAGMSMSEVEAILGKPNRCTEVLIAKKCTWGDERKYITVSFAGDAAVITSAEGL